ncbi:unnamed protein product [Rotaria sp. Silwood2]|nr:unnamed protein product [Rotaria sp. Silwood2]CAF4463846.1 unnamed protein product [Rotaria sp. Silwood2]
MIIIQHTVSMHDSVKISPKKFRENVADRANNTQETTNTILSQCMSKSSDSLLFPSRSKYTLTIAGIINTYDSKINNFDHITYFLLYVKSIQKQYEDNFDFVDGIRKIAVLALMYPDDVRGAFTQLGINHGNTFQGMLDYFENNYIERLRAHDSHVRPLFIAEF